MHKPNSSVPSKNVPLFTSTSNINSLSSLTFNAKPKQVSKVKAENLLSLDLSLHPGLFDPSKQNHRIDLRDELRTSARFEVRPRESNAQTRMSIDTAFPKPVVFSGPAGNGTGKLIKRKSKDSHKKEQDLVGKVNSEERNQLSIYDNIIKSKSKNGLESRAGNEQNQNMEIKFTKKEEEAYDKSCERYVKTESDYLVTQAKEERRIATRPHLTPRNLTSAVNEAEIPSSLNDKADSNKVTKKGMTSKERLLTSQPEVSSPLSGKEQVLKEFMNLKAVYLNSLAQFNKPESTTADKNKKKPQSRYDNAKTEAPVKKHEEEQLINEVQRVKDDMESQVTKNKKSEILQIKDEISNKIKAVDNMKKDLVEKEEQLNQGLNGTLEEIEQFTQDIIKTLKQHAETYKKDITTCYQREVSQIKKVSEKLKERTDEFMRTNQDIETNFHKIAAITDQLFFRKVIEGYSQKITDISDLNTKVKDVMQKVKVPSQDKLVSFKKAMKNMINGILLDTEAKSYKEEQSNQLREQDLEPENCHFEESLRPKKGRRNTNSKLHREEKRLDSEEKEANKTVLISFQNKDIFENALGTPNETSSQANTTLDTNGKTVVSNVFKTESSGSGSNLFYDSRGTPRLNFEIWGHHIDDMKINEFKEEDDKEHQRKVTQVHDLFVTSKFSKALEDIYLTREEIINGLVGQEDYGDSAVETSFLQYLEPVPNWEQKVI